MSLDEGKVIDLSDSSEEWLKEGHIVIDCCGEESESQKLHQGAAEIMLRETPTQTSCANECYTRL